MPLKLALAIRETVAGHRLGALKGGFWHDALKGGEGEKGVTEVTKSPALTEMHSHFALFFTGATTYQLSKRAVQTTPGMHAHPACRLRGSTQENRRSPGFTGEDGWKTGDTCPSGAVEEAKAITVVMLCWGSQQSTGTGHRSGTGTQEDERLARRQPETLCG